MIPESRAVQYFRVYFLNGTPQDIQAERLQQKEGCLYFYNLDPQTDVAIPVAGVKEWTGWENLGVTLRGGGVDG